MFKKYQFTCCDVVHHLISLHAQVLCFPKLELGRKDFVGAYFRTNNLRGPCFLRFLHSGNYCIAIKKQKIISVKLVENMIGLTSRMFGTICDRGRENLTERTRIRMVVSINQERYSITNNLSTVSIFTGPMKLIHRHDSISV